MGSNVWIFLLLFGYGGLLLGRWGCRYRLMLCWRLAGAFCFGLGGAIWRGFPGYELLTLQ